MNKLSQCRELASLLVYSCVYIYALDTSLPWTSSGSLHGKEARGWRRQESGDLFLAQSWVSFVTSGKSLLNIPEPWFPHLERGIGGHKRSFELQDTLIPKDGEFLHCRGISSEASLVPWAWRPFFLSRSAVPALSCLAVRCFLQFRVQGRGEWSWVIGPSWEGVVTVLHH